MDRLTEAWTWIRSDPMRTALAATAAVAAIAAGIAVGLFVTNIRGEVPVGAGSSHSASPSAELSPSASESPSVSPSASPSPSATTQQSASSPSATTQQSASSPSATTQQSASPSAEPTDQATPTPTPTLTPAPQVGIGDTPGGDGPDSLTGTWEELATIPGEDGHPSSVVVLADGRIALFRWNVPASEAMVIYDPAADAWEVPTFDGQLPGTGTDQAFVLGNDDRVYTHDYRLAVEGDTWRREPFELVRETETWAGMQLASGPDGRIYRRADDTGPQYEGTSGRTQIVIYDPSSDTFDRSAAIDGSYDSPVAVGDRLALFGSNAPGNLGLIWYDPAADAWGDQVRYGDSVFRDMGAHARLHLYSLTASPDGTVYAVGSEGPELWAINPEDGSALPVELPEGIGDWRVDLAWHGDALYAIGHGGSWRFTPDP